MQSKKMEKLQKELDEVNAEKEKIEKEMCAVSREEDWDAEDIFRREA